MEARRARESLFAAKIDEKRAGRSSAKVATCMDADAYHLNLKRTRAGFVPSDLVGQWRI